MVAEFGIGDEEVVIDCDVPLLILAGRGRGNPNNNDKPTVKSTSMPGIWDRSRNPMDIQGFEPVCQAIDFWSRRCRGIYKNEVNAGHSTCGKTAGEAVFSA